MNQIKLTKGKRMAKYNLQNNVLKDVVKVTKRVTK